MRIRELARTLRDSVRELPEAQRQERLSMFVRWMVQRRQRKLLPRVVAALSTLETEAGRAPLTMEVAQPISDIPPNAEVSVNPALLGGAAVRSGDDLVDTSLSTQLTRLTQALQS